ncbi:PleD family two-component system response regulator [Chelativorans sp. AA-79]|uniref:PleD family two-component system response regulator n=1 Tax=Chelativorans sp. AA-79 TaxID=3028735 RepID=UPI0023F8A489|nr:PleD family two-component system response regulator [Chelativorans sp. AA-79]WEX11711.1 PleD family two-component system response regulator [Chelativorans sp. AA-79]
MTARILVVDDVPANLRLLEARLLAEYYDVVTARSGPDAIEICEASKIDVVLLDVMMPGMDGFEVCRRLKADPATTHVPVIMITALDQPADRVRGLEAGADDFLTKPVNDLQLLTRVKSLTRLKALTDELRLRAATTRNIGIEQLLQKKSGDSEETPAVLLIDEDEASGRQLQRMLHDHFRLDMAEDPQQGLIRAAEKPYECIIVSSTFAHYDPLRLCSQLRAMDRTRLVPIVLLAGEGDEATVIRGLELAVNDYVLRPVERQELIARLRTQIRRKRYNDSLRSSVAQTVEMAVTDPLTGLHNRRYLDSHLQSLFDRAVARRRPLSVMIIDLDRFKSINDTYGHDGGDVVLREAAARLRRNLRGIDLVCRFGGEEFVVVMPETELEVAERVGERIRLQIAGDSFAVGKADETVTVTVSIGIAALHQPQDTIEALMKRADMALYEAKTAGRNRVVAPAA